MVETHISLSVNRLLNEDTYAIPLYQRNFAWTYDEIEQLLNDVADASQENRDNYYIGTLVVNKENNIFKIIDGQQRTTALNLIALALKHEFGFDRLKAVNLTFPARKKSNENIQKLFIKQKISEDDENELTRGYGHAKDALKKVLGERQLNPQSFVDYLFENVIIFRSILPEDLDLNLYFERFNSRGEQLEAHEILKAQMMAKFGEDQEMAQKFARIWDACADFDKPVASQFKMRRKRADDFQERERIFGWHFTNYSFHNIYNDIDFHQNERRKLSDILGKKINEKNIEVEKDFGDYTTIIDFPTFLLHVLAIAEGKKTDEIQLDDKKLLALFDIKNKDKTWVIEFSEFLLRIKHIFDNYIVRNSNTDSSSRNKDEWFLQKGAYYEYQPNGKAKEHYIVEERFTKNTFSDSESNQNIILLQSMFAVTFTANRDSRWLYEILQFLFNHIEELNQTEFASLFKDFLEKMAVRYAEERLFTEDKTIKKYGAIPVYAFNFVDYVLWKNREELKKSYDVKFEDFKFAYRRSIEHWFPQHPNSDERVEKIDDKFLHSFGNLCIITDSQNSKFGNLVPSAKYKQWEGIFNRQSLKLQMMADVTVKNDKWGICEIQSMEKEVERYVHDFCDS
ncbi:GmrSD restriction endonuclease domain-containing protein [Streptococcus sp. KHUD_014]|uniref:GmrSD restriction endonuclease domain-containing protein n=1 Tax=Streptococcus sp. KHUD_014 TaxID=3434353 RepID=UPI003DA36D07